MARVFLNEGTEIDIKESKKELRELIRECAKREKEEIKDNFVEVHCIRFYGKNGEIKPINTKIDLYTKRILFHYDI